MAETPPPFIRRQILARLEEALGQARVVVLNGPRQAGKTTIARRIAASRGGTYWSLDAPETQSILERDPTGLLDSPPAGGPRRVPDRGRPTASRDQAAD